MTLPHRKRGTYRTLSGKLDLHRESKGDEELSMQEMLQRLEDTDSFEQKLQHVTTPRPKVMTVFLHGTGNEASGSMLKPDASAIAHGMPTTVRPETETILDEFCEAITTDAAIINGIGSKYGYGYAYHADGNPGVQHPEWRQDLRPTRTKRFGRVTDLALGTDLDRNALAAVAEIQRYRELHGELPDKIVLVGRSRGAVTAIMAAQMVQDIFQGAVKVDIFALEPVAGPTNRGMQEYRRIPACVEQFTVVLAENETGIGFGPQDRARLYTESMETRVKILSYPGDHKRASKARQEEHSGVARLAFQDMQDFLVEAGVSFRRPPKLPRIGRSIDRKKKQYQYDAARSLTSKDKLKLWASIIVNAEKYGTKTKRDYLAHKGDFQGHPQFFVTEEHRVTFKEHYPDLYNYFFCQNTQEHDPETILETLSALHEKESKEVAELHRRDAAALLQSHLDTLDPGQKADFPKRYHILYEYFIEGREDITFADLHLALIEYSQGPREQRDVVHGLRQRLEVSAGNTCVDLLVKRGLVTREDGGKLSFSIRNQRAHKMIQRFWGEDLDLEMLETKQEDSIDLPEIAKSKLKYLAIISKYLLGKGVLDQDETAILELAEKAKLWLEEDFLSLENFEAVDSILHDMLESIEASPTPNPILHRMITNARVIPGHERDILREKVRVVRSACYNEIARGGAYSEEARQTWKVTKTICGNQQHNGTIKILALDHLLRQQQRLLADDGAKTCAYAKDITTAIDLQDTMLQDLRSFADKYESSFIRRRRWTLGFLLPVYNAPVLRAKREIAQRLGEKLQDLESRRSAMKPERFLIELISALQTALGEAAFARAQHNNQAPGRFEASLNEFLITLKTELKQLVAQMPQQAPSKVFATEEDAAKVEEAFPDEDWDDVDDDATMQQAPAESQLPESCHHAATSRMFGQSQQPGGEQGDGPKPPSQTLVR